MSNPAVTITGASEAVCFLCSAEGSVFEATTPCGRLVALPVCAKDLFAIVVAQTRTNAGASRGPTRGRGKPVVKSRSGGSDEPDSPPDAEASSLGANSSAA